MFFSSVYLFTISDCFSERLLDSNRCRWSRISKGWYLHQRRFGTAKSRVNTVFEVRQVQCPRTVQLVVSTERRQIYKKYEKEVVPSVSIYYWELHANEYSWLLRCWFQVQNSWAKITDAFHDIRSEFKTLSSKPVKCKTHSFHLLTTKLKIRPSHALGPKLNVLASMILYQIQNSSLPRSGAKIQDPWCPHSYIQNSGWNYTNSNC